MIRHILVPASGTEGDRSAFATALAVARMDGAHLQFLHATLDVSATIAAMVGDGMGGGSFIASTIDNLEADAKAQQATARQAVADFCAASGVVLDAPAAQPGQVSAEFSATTGDAANCVADAGRFADIVVARRPVGDQMEIGVVEAALVATGRPMLLASDAAVPELPGVVVIAWKDRPEAARAVAAALPFLERATRVVIVSVEEDGAAPRESCERLQRSLRWHNAATEVFHIPQGERPAVDVLLEQAARMGASLLVMGGYSHSRLREMVFGGFTRSVLAQAALPVLMSH
jgi:nucleotide-binding universal stress UspA family protein